jgi:hypothetical protein
MPVPLFREIVRKFLDVVETNIKVRTETASWINRYLTNNEERQFILFCTIMCEVGYGISKPELKSLIDEYVNADAILPEMEESSSKNKHFGQQECLISSAKNKDYTLGYGWPSLHGKHRV